MTSKVSAPDDTPVLWNRRGFFGLLAGVVGVLPFMRRKQPVQRYVLESGRGPYTITVPSHPPNRWYLLTDGTGKQTIYPGGTTTELHLHPVDIVWWEE